MLYYYYREKKYEFSIEIFFNGIESAYFNIKYRPFDILDNRTISIDELKSYSLSL